GFTTLGIFASTSNLVVMAQCFRFGWRRCSPLNWALGLSVEKQYLTKLNLAVLLVLGVLVGIFTYRQFLVALLYELAFQLPLKLVQIIRCIHAFGFSVFAFNSIL
ncbi:hypothetical protein CGH20_24785, partial [Vibrio parahaemolyticus]